MRKSVFKIKVKFFLIVLGFIHVLLSCDSPRNHRILEGSKSLGTSMLNDNVGFMSLRLDNLEFTIRFFWIKGPYPSPARSSVLGLFVYDENQNLTSLPENLILEFDSLMPGMGHGPDDVGYFEQVSFGVYENRNIYFSMGGEWTHQLRIQNHQEETVAELFWDEFL